MILSQQSFRTISPGAGYSAPVAVSYRYLYAFSPYDRTYGYGSPTLYRVLSITDIGTISFLLGSRRSGRGFSIGCALTVMTLGRRRFPLAFDGASETLRSAATGPSLSSLFSRNVRSGPCSRFIFTERHILASFGRFELLFGLCCRVCAGSRTRYVSPNDLFVIFKLSWQ